MKNRLGFLGFTISLLVMACSSSLPADISDVEYEQDSSVLHTHFKPNHDFETDYDFWKVVEEVRNDENENDAGTAKKDSGVIVDSGPVVSSVSDSSVDNPSQPGHNVDDAGPQGPPSNNNNGNGNGNNQHNSCVRFLDVWICKNKCG